MPIIYRSIDAETGEEIITFMRRGKVVGMVRDTETKRWIRGFKGFTVQVSLLFDYPKNKARAYNPLYIDVKIVTFVGVDEVTKVEDIEQELTKTATNVIHSYFGEFVAELAVIAGAEHKIEMTEEVYPDFHWYVIWHHYLRDEKEEDGIDTIG